MIAAASQLRSVGRVANEAQTPVNRVLQIAEAAKISPALSLDGVPFFTDADSQRLTEAVYAQRPTRPTTAKH